MSEDLNEIIYKNKSLEVVISGFKQKNNALLEENSAKNVVISKIKTEVKRATLNDGKRDGATKGTNRKIARKLFQPRIKYHKLVR